MISEFGKVSICVMSVMFMFAIITIVLLAFFAFDFVVGFGIKDKD